MSGEGRNVNEILLAALINLKGVFCFSALVSGLTVLLSGVFFLMAKDLGKTRDQVLSRKALKVSSLVFVPMMFLSCIPTIDDLWKVRIGLIKLQLASPENITSAAETIERIGKKLECKYIGCDEEKAEKK